MRRARQILRRSRSVLYFRSSFQNYVADFDSEPQEVVLRDIFNDGSCLPRAAANNIPGGVGSPKVEDDDDMDTDCEENSRDLGKGEST